MAIDEQRLQQLMGRGANDFGAAVFAALVVVGDELGLYRAMADSGPMTPAQLAGETNTAERYVREWLCAHVAGGYVDYDPGTETFSLSPEQALVLADESMPGFLPPAFRLALAATEALPKITDAFRTGAGVSWGEHSPALFHSMERFFAPNYRANLVDSWIPAVEGAEDKLTAGALAADVGCGHGISTIEMARAYPRSRFIGFDSHAPSIERARQAAAEAGVDGRVSFQVADARDFPGDDYDFAAFFDCLHDMGDPVGACRRLREALKADGVVLLVEPYANDRLEENINPVSRAFYAGSVMMCTPCSLAQDVGLALGAQAGEPRMREVFSEAGFSHFRRAAETPFNIVYEARP